MSDKLKQYVRDYVRLRNALTDEKSQVDIFQLKRTIAIYMMRNAGENLYVFADEERVGEVIVVRLDHMSENVFINRRKIS